MKISAILLIVLMNAPYTKEHYPVESRLLSIQLLLLLPMIGQRTWRQPIAKRFSPSQVNGVEKVELGVPIQLREELLLLNYLLLILFLLCFRLLHCPVLTIRTLPTLLGTVTKKNHSQG